VTDTLLQYISVTTILAATPGATTAVVIRNTVARGRRAGLLVAAGAALANTTWAILAAVGVAVLIAHSPPILRILRDGGGLYLLWLGGRSLVRALTPRAHDALPAPTTTAANAHAAFRQGLLTNLLNPPIMTFYLIVVPTFLPPGGGAGAFAMLAAIHISIAFACHAIWATAFATIGHWLSSAGAKRVLDGATGVAMLFLAARVLLK